MVDKTTVAQLSVLEREGTNTVDAANKVIEPAREIVDGVLAAFTDTQTPAEASNASDIRTRLLLKYYMVDVDIFNTHDSAY